MKFHGLTSANDIAQMDVPNGSELPVTHDAGNLFVLNGTTPILHFSDGTDWNAVPPSDVVTTVTAAPATFDDVKQGRYVNFRWKPSSDSSSVVAADYLDVTIDTTDGNTIGTSHAVGQFIKMQAVGGGTTITNFAHENRYGIKDSTVAGEFVGKTHVLDPDADASGSLNTLTLELMNDQSSTSTWVSNIERRFLDGRMVDYFAGGLVRTPMLVVSNHTFSDRDSGKDILFFSATDATFTIPSDISDGFTVNIIQGNTGRATVVGVGHTVFNAGGQTQTSFPFQSVKVSVSTSTVAVLSFSDGGPASKITETRASGTNAFKTIDVDYAPTSNTNAVTIGQRTQINYSGTSNITSGGWLTATQNVVNVANSGTIDKIVLNMNQLNVGGTTGNIAAAVGYEAVISAIPAGRAIGGYAGFYFPNLTAVPNINNVAALAAFANDHPNAIIRNAGKYTNGAGVELAPPLAIPLVNGRYYSAPLSGYGTAGSFANVAYIVPVHIPHRTTITKLGVAVTSAAAGTSGRLALYKVVAPGIAPQLVVDGGIVSTATTGDKEATVNVTVDAGTYFIAGVTNGSPTLRTHNLAPHQLAMYGQGSSSSAEGVMYYNFPFGAFPAELAASPQYSTAGGQPHLWYRVGV